MKRIDGIKSSAMSASLSLNVLDEVVVKGSAKVPWDARPIRDGGARMESVKPAGR